MHPPPPRHPGKRSHLGSALEAASLGSEQDILEIQLEVGIYAGHGAGGALGPARREPAAPPCGTGWGAGAAGSCGGVGKGGGAAGTRGLLCSGGCSAARARRALKACGHLQPRSARPAPWGLRPGPAPPPPPGRGPGDGGGGGPTSWGQTRRMLRNPLV